jgi:hypothetical protein
MQRAQIKITLTPKYRSLRQLVLVVTCAPSLENCYVFEICTQHALKDFGEFDVEGDEVVRRWYTLRWEQSTDGLVAKIAARLGEVAREHLETIERRLNKE